MKLPIHSLEVKEWLDETDDGVVTDIDDIDAYDSGSKIGGGGCGCSMVNI